MTVFDTIPQLIKMLQNLDRWLEAGVAHAQKKSFDPNVLAEARLAPDQYHLARQVQAACDAAKNLAAHLAGQKPPVHPDTEKTIAELRTRIATCVSYLQGFKESDFAGAEERHVVLPFLAPKWIRGDHFHSQLALPNFYFHVTTAYAILRHNGIDLGKRDFIGNMPVNE